MAPALQGQRASFEAQPTPLVQKTGQRPTPRVISSAWVADGGMPASAKPEVAPSAAAQKNPECLTLELGDGLLSALKLFTGH